MTFGKAHLPYSPSLKNSIKRAYVLAPALRKFAGRWVVTGKRPKESHRLGLVLESIV
jgi:hypothetical protein